MKNILAIAAIVATLFISCKKENDPVYDPNIKAPLSVEFDNIAGSSDLELNSGSYTNSSGESFNVTSLKYYVSNFVLTRTDGTIYKVPQDECYFLIDESNEDSHEPILNVPEGEYKTVSFMLGVDSLKSTADMSQRTGVLDPAGEGSGMYWDANSGYIFFNMEGNSTAATGGSYTYHIGGYGGQTTPTVNNIKTITLDLTARGIPQVKSGKETNIHLMVDILKMFSSSSTISIAAHNHVELEPFSSTVSNNYTAMFRHDHTEN